jgi:hypothetical protein
MRTIDLHGGLNQELPAAADVSIPEIAAAIKAFEDLRRRYRAAVETHFALEREELPRALEQDVQAHADAIRAGKPAPGRKHEEKAQGALDKVRREREALDTAVADSAVELEDLMRAHRAVWATSVDREILEARKAFASVLEDLAAAGAELERLGALAVFVAAPDRSFRSRPAVIPTLRRQSGEPYQMREIFDRLAEAVAPTPTPPAPPTPTTLMPRAGSAPVDTVSGAP